MAPWDGPLCPSDISPAGENLVVFAAWSPSPALTPSESPPGRGRVLLDWREGMLAARRPTWFRAASFRSMPRPGLSVRMMVPLWGDYVFAV